MTQPASLRAVWFRRFALGGAALVFAALIYLGHTVLFGAKLGRDCLVTSDCKWGGTGRRVCLQQHWGYCTRPCRTPADCPAGWTCDADAGPGSACRRPKGE